VLFENLPDEANAAFLRKALISLTPARVRVAYDDDGVFLHYAVAAFDSVERREKCINFVNENKGGIWPRSVTVVAGDRSHLEWVHRSSKRGKSKKAYTSPMGTQSELFKLKDFSSLEALRKLRIFFIDFESACCTSKGTPFPNEIGVSPFIIPPYSTLPPERRIPQARIGFGRGSSSSSSGNQKPATKGFGSVSNDSHASKLSSSSAASTARTSSLFSSSSFHAEDSWRCIRPSALPSSKSTTGRFQLPWSLHEIQSADFHTFIDPGPIPVSLTRSALWIRDNVTGIPIRSFHLAEKNLGLIWQELHRYLRGEDGPKAKVYLFAKGPALENRILTLMSQRACKRAGFNLDDSLHVVREAEELVQVLYALSPLHHVSYETVKEKYLELMTQTRERQCPFHEELDIHRHCALGDARQISDVLCDIYSYIHYEPSRLEPPPVQVPTEKRQDLEASWQAQLHAMRNIKPSSDKPQSNIYQWKPTSVTEQVDSTNFDVNSDDDDVNY